MAYDIRLIEHNDYLEVEISGNRVHRQEAYNSGLVWTQIAEACKKKGYTRILAISKLTGPLSTVEAYKIAESPEGYGWCRLWRLAFVDMNNESRKNNLFAETVAVNRGYRTVKVFDDEKDAKAWLLEA